MSSLAIDRLIFLLARLPGLGHRSARRMTLHMLQHRQTVLAPLTAALVETANSVINCFNCGNLDISDPCSICNDTSRDASMICVVEHISDLWALERSGLFRGRYHVLGGALSAMEGMGPDDLMIDRLLTNVTAGNVREVIIATSATVDGQTTAHYIADSLRKHGIILSGLAHGMPMGGELDELDDGTILAAFKARRPL